MTQLSTSSQQIISSKNVAKSFHSNVTLVVDVHAMGIYLKVHHVGRVGNLQPIALLE
jgi:hypothetical protein